MVYLADVGPADFDAPAAWNARVAGAYYRAMRPAAIASLVDRVVDGLTVGGTFVCLTLSAKRHPLVESSSKAFIRILPGVRNGRAGSGGTEDSRTGRLPHARSENRVVPASHRLHPPLLPVANAPPIRRALSDWILEFALASSLYLPHRPLIVRDLLLLHRDGLGESKDSFTQIKPVSSPHFSTGREQVRPNCKQFCRRLLFELNDIVQRACGWSAAGASPTDGGNQDRE